MISRLAPGRRQTPRIVPMGAVHQSLRSGSPGLLEAFYRSQRASPQRFHRSVGSCFLRGLGVCFMVPKKEFRVRPSLQRSKAAEATPLPRSVCGLGPSREARCARRPGAGDTQRRPGCNPVPPVSPRGSARRRRLCKCYVLVSSVVGFSASDVVRCFVPFAPVYASVLDLEVWAVLRSHCIVRMTDSDRGCPQGPALSSWGFS